MKESYREYLASHSGLNPYAGDGNIAGVASVRGNTGQPLSSEIINSRVPILFCHGEGNTARAANGKVWVDTAESKTLRMCGHSKRENREILSGVRPVAWYVTGWRTGQKTPQVVLLT